MMLMPGKFPGLMPARAAQLCAARAAFWKGGYESGEWRVEISESGEWRVESGDF